jgi:enoyl-CoA hydratase/carnithine racemase
VINGPAAIHAELPALGDIVLAADDAYIQDAAHIPAGVTPGDGVHAIWMEMLGPNRGRHFLLSGRKLGATELLAAGIVAEVLPRERLLARATELAHQLASLPSVTMRNTRLLVTQQLKRLLLNELGHGLALQGLSIYALNERPDAIGPRYMGD